MRTALAILLVLPGVAAAQEAQLELLRSDLRTERLAILTEAMELDSEQGAVFWPIYRSYDLERSRLGDTRLVLLKDFAASFDTMNEEKASELAAGSFRLAEQQLALEKKYYAEVETAQQALEGNESRSAGSGTI